MNNVAVHKVKEDGQCQKCRGSIRSALRPFGPEPFGPERLDMSSSTCLKAEGLKAEGLKAEGLSTGYRTRR